LSSKKGQAEASHFVRENVTKKRKTIVKNVVLIL